VAIGSRCVRRGVDPFVLSWLGSARRLRGNASVPHFRIPAFPSGRIFHIVRPCFSDKEPIPILGFSIPFCSPAHSARIRSGLVQKYVIGRWCPLCVGIALSVAMACVLIAWSDCRRLRPEFMAEKGIS